MLPRVLVAGVGDVFHGDAGFGPEASRQLQAGALPEGVSVVDYGTRPMHLVYDLLEGFDALVVLDSLPRQRQPGRVVAFEVDPEVAGEDSPTMTPSDVLSGLALLGGRLPRTFVVRCEPQDSREHLGLSEPVRQAVPQAVGVVLDLLQVLPHS